MILHHIKLALRILQRNKLYSIMSIIGLSVGFAVCLIIGLFIYGETTMDTWMPDYKRIVRVIDSKDNLCSLDIKLNQEFKDKLPEVEQACTMELNGGFDISVKSGQHSALSKGIIGTTDDFFKVFPLRVIHSNSNQLLEGKQSIIITQSLAGTLFPNEDALGKPITILNFIVGQITAVVEDFPENSSICADIFINCNNEDFRFNQNCNNGKCWSPTNHFLLLRENTDHTSLQNKLNRIAESKVFEIKSLTWQKLTDIYLSPPVNGNAIELGSWNLVWLFVGIGALVLMLSIINFINFYISMQYSRLKIIFIKKVIGAQHKQLLSYSFIEVSISIILSVFFSLILFQLFFPLANDLFNHQLNEELLYSPNLIFLFTFAVLAIILIICLIPAFVLTKYKFGNSLSLIKTSSIKQTRRRIMTTGQFTISIFLIILTFLLFRQLNYIKHIDLGFQKENLIRLNFPFTFNHQTVLREKLNRMNSINSFTFSSGMPGNIRLGMGEIVNDKQINFQCLYTDDNFFQTFGIQIKKGRAYKLEEMGRACVINEEAYKQYEWKNLEGKRFNNGKDGGYEVIGVTDNFFVESLHNKIGPVCILSAENNDAKNLQYVTIRLNSGNLGDQMKELNKTWASLIPDEPMNYTFYDEQFDAMYKKEERLGKAIAIAAIIALILTFMGVLGQAFQMCLNRTKEIGIRKVNGARVSEILILFNKTFAKWVAIAFVIASPIAYYAMNKWLENFAYKTALSWWVFALSGIITLAIVLLTVSWQTYKVAHRNPTEALRYE